MSDQPPETGIDDDDQDSGPTNQAPPGERPSDPEQIDGTVDEDGLTEG